MKYIHLIFICTFLVSCGPSNEDQKKVRFTTDENVRDHLIIQFPDETPLEIALYEVAPHGASTSLWKNELLPQNEGLGANVFVQKSERGVAISGRGSDFFLHHYLPEGEHEVPIRGAQAGSIREERLIWWSFLDGKEIPVGSLPIVPTKLSEIEDWCKGHQVSGVVLTARQIQK